MKSWRETEQAAREAFALEKTCKVLTELLQLPGKLEDIYGDKTLHRVIDDDSLEGKAYTAIIDYLCSEINDDDFEMRREDVQELVKKGAYTMTEKRRLG